MPANLENSVVATRRKGQFSFQSQGKAMPKIVQSTAQLHSSHTLAKQCSKFSKLDFNTIWTESFQMFELYFEKVEIRYQIANIRCIIEKPREFQKNIYFCFIDYAKAFDCVDHNKLWKILKERNTRPPYLSPEKPVCRSRSNN